MLIKKSPNLELFNDLAKKDKEDTIKDKLMELLKLNFFQVNYYRNAKFLRKSLIWGVILFISFTICIKFDYLNCFHITLNILKSIIIPQLVRLDF